MADQSNSTNPYFERFITFWKSADFTGWNESDIREDFISPLLNLLGYAKNTVDHIIREQNLNLQEKYHRIGRKQIAIDYIPTVRLKKFWIIEAKPGNPKEMNFGDLLQAHFYAIHPEINARFIVMINGWEIRVYDALNSNDWDNYLILCDQQNCQEIFHDLVNTLGSQSMSSYLRKYILSTVKESLLAEVDISLAESLKSDVFKIYMEAMPVIRQNAQDFQMQEWRKLESGENERLKSLTIPHLLVHMDIPIDTRAKFGMEYAQRIIAAKDTERDQLYLRLKQTCYGRPHNIFRVQVIATILDLIRAKLVINDGDEQVDLGKDLVSLANYNMSYWDMNYPDPCANISKALCHLDNTCARLAYKSARRFAMEPLKELVDAKLSTYSIRDLLVNPPTIAKEIVVSVGFVNEMLWRKSMEQNGADVWSNIWLMQDVEDVLNNIPEVPYSNNDHDLLWFDQYGIDFDILRIGTWALLDGDRKSLQENGLMEALSPILNLTRDDVKGSMPAPLIRPVGWEPKQNAALTRIKEILQQVPEKK